MPRIALVTCNRWPDRGASDQLYAGALGARGCTVCAAAWNGVPDPFGVADAAVLRAAWDYADAPVAFQRWLDLLEAAGTPLFNPPALVRWNLDKRYLLDLADAGVAVPPLRVLDDARAILTTLDGLPWERAVVKPVIGQSGRGVRLVERGHMPDLDDIAADGRAVLLQEFVPEVQDGELALVFFDGVFSHAFARVPAAGELRVNSQYEGRVEAAEVSGAVVAQARAVLDTLPEIPLYARIDCVLRDGRLLLMELELIEPSLALTIDPPSAERFAVATLRRLR